MSNHNITPIFILGAPRSGTTLLGGLLSQHSRIAGISHERYRGLKETDLFSSFKQYFRSIQHPVDLVVFVEAFAATDYFQLTGLKKGTFYRRRPKTIEAFFRIMMDEYAIAMGADFWIEKSPSHTLYFKQLNKHFPDARYIVIRRNLLESIRSMVFMANKTHHPLKQHMVVAKITISYALYNRAIGKVIKDGKKKVLSIDYAALVEDMTGTCKRIYDFLGIPFEEKTAIPPYPANTSFPNGKKRKSLSLIETLFAKLIIAVSWLMPYCLMTLCATLYRKRRFKRPLAHHWGMLLEEHGFSEEKCCPGGWSGVPHISSQRRQ